MITPSAPFDEKRLADMRALLRDMRPASGPEALSALRRFFPDVPLADRMRVIEARTY